MKSAPTRVSVLLLCCVFALCVYRAATQAFTIDEAFTFLHYVDTPWRDVFGEYSSNNHVLFSLVSRVFRYRFGRSEIVLRIPALIGCILFQLASFRICRRALGDSWLLPLALAVLTLHPLVLDFMVAARGYGLGMGLFWWALYFIWTEKPWAAGVVAGLSIATNMIFLVPLAALGAVAIPIYARRKRFWELIQSYAVPALVISFAILVIPISKSAGQFYYGATTLRDTVSSLVNESVPDTPPYLAGHVVPIAFFLAVALGVWLLVARKDTLLPYVLGCMGLSVLGWVAMHRILGFPYPLNRTALYMLPLAGLAIVAGAASVPWKTVSIPLGALAAALSIVYVAQIRTAYFNEWREEAGINHLVRRLGNDAAELSKARQVTAGGTWILEYSMRYYGKRYRFPWLKVLDAKERESLRPDYYILTAGEASKVDELRLRVIEKDALSGTLLARSN
jgi:hypothetical protein